SGQAREPEVDRLIRRRSRGRGGDRKEGRSRTRRGRGRVVDAIGAEVRQGAPITVRRGSVPRSVKHSGARRIRCTENCSQGQTKTHEPPPFEHERDLPRGRPPCPGGWSPPSFDSPAIRLAA